MSYKIKQIIPAPSDMWAMYCNPQKVRYLRVVCLALLEGGADWGMLAIVWEDKGFKLADSIEYFEGIVYSPKDLYE